MANLGLVGRSTLTIPTPALHAGPPLWWNPLAAKTPVSFQYAHGPQPGVAAFLNGRVPAVLVVTIVSDFGNVGGGIWTF